MPADDDLAVLRERCSHFLHGHGPVRAADLLATIPPDTRVDRYGDGGVVAELEDEVASVLGKESAAFLPSGTMAQQAVLRVHADRRHWLLPGGPGGHRRRGAGVAAADGRHATRAVAER